MSRGRSLSLAEPRPGSGVKDVTQRNKGIKMADRAQWRMNKMAKVGRGRAQVIRPISCVLLRTCRNARGRAGTCWLPAFQRARACRVPLAMLRARPELS
jgi:hypothetical protein